MELSAQRAAESERQVTLLNAQLVEARRQIDRLRNLLDLADREVERLRLEAAD